MTKAPLQKSRNDAFILSKSPIGNVITHNMQRTSFIIRKKGTRTMRIPLLLFYKIQIILPIYIMPPMPGCAIGAAAFSSGLSQMRHSVVRNMPAIDAAFSRATRSTLAGSMTPAARRSS